MMKTELLACWFSLGGSLVMSVCHRTGMLLLLLPLLLTTNNSNFGIETLVDELHMSRSSLFRKIKSLTGLSLSGFIRSIRLKKAAHLILVSELNLSQISYEVGFNDYKYFKTSFKKQFNCLPSKYKEIYNKNA